LDQPQYGYNEQENVNEVFLEQVTCVLDRYNGQEEVFDGQQCLFANEKTN
jgi:hypothetical protein